jgi:hypothetical protein
MPRDVFVSYAHSDDVPPRMAQYGWVTTFVVELKKVLRRKLGGAGADVWQDHQLASNQKVPDTLVQEVRDSRTIVLFMSPGYLQSRWCHDELDTFLRDNQATKNQESVFVVAIEHTDRESWPARVRDLTPIQLYQQTLGGETELLGYPNPPSEGGLPYWTKLNEVAHLIARHLELLNRKQPDVPPIPSGSGLPRSANADVRDAARSLPVVWIAQPTEDLHVQWESLASAIRQRGVNVRPLGHSTYPLSDPATFRASVEADLAASTLVIQLVSAAPGAPIGSGAATTTALQSALALVHAQTSPGVVMLKWRPSEIQLDQIKDEAHRSLLQGAIASGFEQFRQQVLETLDRILRPSPTVPHRAGQSGPDSLSFCVTAGPKDGALSEDVARVIEGMGHVSYVVPASPERDQTQAEYREQLNGLLSDVNGVILVHGRESGLWVQSRHSQVRKVLAQRQRGIWGAYLDAPPAKEASVRILDPGVVSLDCRDGVRAEPILGFVNLVAGR